MKRIKILTAFVVAIILTAALTVPSLASGGVSGAIEATWQDAAGQVKTIVNSVVFPAISLILVVLFFVKLATSYMDYRKHGQFEFTGPAILFVGLILALTAPLYLWTILGI